MKKYVKDEFQIMIKKPELFISRIFITITQIQYQFRKFKLKIIDLLNFSF